MASEAFWTFLSIEGHPQAPVVPEVLLLRARRAGWEVELKPRAGMGVEEGRRAAGRRLGPLVGCRRGERLTLPPQPRRQPGPEVVARPASGVRPGFPRAPGLWRFMFPRTSPLHPLLSPGGFSAGQSGGRPRQASPEGLYL